MWDSSEHGPCPPVHATCTPQGHPWPDQWRTLDILSGRAMAQGVEISGSKFPQTHELQCQTGWSLGLSPMLVGTVPVTRRSVGIHIEKQEKGEILTALHYLLDREHKHILLFSSGGAM